MLILSTIVTQIGITNYIMGCLLDSLNAKIMITCSKLRHNQKFSNRFPHTTPPPSAAAAVSPRPTTVAAGL